MHAADGFAAPLAMCGTVLRCCVKVKIAHPTVWLALSRPMSVLKRQTKRMNLRAGLESQVLILAN